MSQPNPHLSTPRSRFPYKLLLLVTIVASACELVNNTPSVSISTESDFVLTGERITLTAVTQDLDEDVLKITWRASDGTLSKLTGDEVQWTAPLDRVVVTISVVADDRKGSTGIDSASTTITVVNDAPVISDFFASDNYVLLGNAVDLTVVAEDPDGEVIEYSFTTSPAGIGLFSPTADPTIISWRAPTVDETPFARVYDIVAKAKDVRGFFSTDTLNLLVYSEYGTVWIADSRHNTVSKYSDRGDFILESEHSFTRPVALTKNIGSPYDPDYGAYVADQGTGEIVKIGPKGEMEFIVTGLPNVIDIAHHLESGTIWALSPGDSSLSVVNAVTRLVVKKVYGFDQPKVIKINQNNGDVWILDSGKNVVVLLDANAIASIPDTVTSLNSFVFANQLDGPSDIAVRNQNIGATVFIADKRDSDGEIEQLTTTGTNYSFGTTFATYNQPSLVASTVEERLWVANSTGSVDHYLVSVGSGSKFGVFSYDFNNPHTMRADPVTGEVWIGDNGTNEVVKLIAPDSTDVIISGFGFIEDLIINK